MTLSFEKIREITVGAAYVEDGAEGIRFHRFNPEEEKLYSITVFAEKCSCNAGVRLDFITDAKSMFFKANICHAGSRGYFACDVAVDCTVIGSIQNVQDADKEYLINTYEYGVYEKRFDLGDGEKRVTVYLPWSADLRLMELTLDGETFAHAYEYKKTVLMYGDSITQGYDAVHPSNTYAARFCDALDACGYNKAIGGEVFNSALARIRNDILPDYITVAYGTNDWSSTTAEIFTRECRGFFKALSENYPNAKIFALTPIWRGDCQTPNDFGEFSIIEEGIHSACKEYENIVCIRGLDLVPHDTGLYADGWLHPNDAGFGFFSENLMAEIAEHI